MLHNKCAINISIITIKMIIVLSKFPELSNLFELKIFSKVDDLSSVALGDVAVLIMPVYLFFFQAILYSWHLTICIEISLLL